VGLLELLFYGRGSTDHGWAVSQKEAAEGYFKERFVLNDHFYGLPFAREAVIALSQYYDFEWFRSTLDGVG